MKVCFTGHRPQSLPFGTDEQHPLCLELKARLAEEIQAVIKNGADTFYTGMALGVDTFAAEAVLKEKEKNPSIKLIAAVPCPSQSNSWSEAEKARYNAILERCDEVAMVSDHYYRGCMHVRNRYMADRSDLLIAVYDGHSKGGTASTVQYAQKKGLTIIQLIP